MAEHGAHNLSYTAQPHCTTHIVCCTLVFTAHHCTVLSFSEQIICPGRKNLAAKYGGREGKGEVRPKHRIGLEIHKRLLTGNKSGLLFIQNQKILFIKFLFFLGKWCVEQGNIRVKSMTDGWMNGTTYSTGMMLLESEKL